MTKKNLLDEIARNPGHYYRVPADVLRDRRFGDDERVLILEAWRETGGDAAEIQAALDELKGRSLAAE